MEGRRASISPYPLHICHWRQLDGLYRQKDHERAGHPARLALGRYIHIINNYYLADGCYPHQHTVWPVPVFYQLYPKNGRKNGFDERPQPKNG